MFLTSSMLDMSYMHMVLNTYTRGQYEAPNTCVGNTLEAQKGMLMCVQQHTTGFLRIESTQEPNNPKNPNHSNHPNSPRVSGV